MKNRHDKTYYNIHKTCFNCVIDYEHELKKEGKWEEYQLGIKNNELDNRIKEFKLWIQEKLEESNNSFISEDGDMEKWVGKIDKDKVEQYVKEVEEYLTSLKQ
jgi:CHASE3 domain sensor protein